MTRTAPRCMAVLALLVAAPVLAAPGVIPKSLPGGPELAPDLRAKLARSLAERAADYVPRTKHRREDGSPVYTNRLLLEASPYLQQHAHNPVNWYPWGDEAFAAARRLKRPVLVSIGYSTCHWCHVMEEESFDDPEIAEYLNRHFIAVKVDREVRPDVDAIYMAALHALGQRGGWPLNVWVTPDRKPFYGGTYFPPRDREGRPGLLSVLGVIQRDWANDAARFERYAEPLADRIRQHLEGRAAESTRVPSREVIARAVAEYAADYDEMWGGVGGAPKFPSSLPVRVLLRHHRVTGDARALEMATHTLQQMARGGIYDHLGGGFHRYSTDERWLVPHFEKMLYDNALLAVAYIEGWQVTGREDFERVVRETLDYVAREMTSPEGGFYSATDADSPDETGELEEGRFFTWTREEIDAALDPKSAAAVKRWYSIMKNGNYEGRTVLHAWRQHAVIAEKLGVGEAELVRTLEAARKKLYTVRAERPPPLRDDKILAAWNGLMISAFARAALAFDDPAYADRAVRAAEQVLGDLRPDGRLRRVYLDGRASGPAFLEDYAFVIAALLDLYEVRPDPRWLREAIALQAVLDRDYADPTGGGYWKTATGHESLLAREKPGRDGAVPSGNSASALNLLRLLEFTGDEQYASRATLLFSAFSETLEQAPGVLADMLLALDFQHDRRLEIVLVKPAGGGSDRAMLAPLRTAFVPTRVLSIVTEGEDLAAHASLVPHVEGRVARGGQVTAYVCENRVCSFPTNDPRVFADQLGPQPAAPGS